MIDTAAGEKTLLHPRNRHRGRYDYPALVACSPELAAFLRRIADAEESLDFSDPAAVRALNRALLTQTYGITGWDIPDRYLCPPIPGRADYLHYLADLLAESHGGTLPRGESIHVLDIGVGANCIYPLIGHSEYGWHFVGTDIDRGALAAAQANLDANSGYPAAIELRLQASRLAIFAGALRPLERFDLSMCNPPFHASLADANAGSRRKWRNLGKAARNTRLPALNFGGQPDELCCAGGEAAFVSRMIAESKRIPDRCLWFTTLVSRSANLPTLVRALKTAGVRESRNIEMAQGQKKSRIVAWTFLDEGQRRAWQTAGGMSPMTNPPERLREKTISI